MFWFVQSLKLNIWGIETNFYFRKCKKIETPTTRPAPPGPCTYLCRDCGYIPGFTCQLVPGTECTYRCLPPSTTEEVNLYSVEQNLIKKSHNEDKALVIWLVILPVMYTAMLLCN